MRENSWLTKNLLASQEGLCCMELVSCKVCTAMFYKLFLGTYTQNIWKRLLAVTLVFPSVRMEQLGSHREDFHEILYLIIFKKICGK